MAVTARLVRTSAAVACALTAGAALLGTPYAGAAPRPPAVPAVPVLATVSVAYDAAGTARLLALVNEHRRAIGLRALVVNTNLTRVARSWTVTMATTQTLAHNDALFTRTEHAALRIAAFGENVAYSSASVDDAHQMLMHSPHHLANIETGAFAVAGFAVVTDVRGWYWVTEDFGSAPKTAATAAVTDRSGTTAAADAARATAAREAATRTAAARAAAAAGAARQAEAARAARATAARLGAATARAAQARAAEAAVALLAADRAAEAAAAPSATTGTSGAVGTSGNHATADPATVALGTGGAGGRSTVAAAYASPSGHALPQIPAVPPAAALAAVLVATLCAAHAVTGRLEA
jgi:uncharacterized protein YkwD